MGCLRAHVRRLVLCGVRDRRGGTFLDEVLGGVSRRVVGWQLSTSLRTDLALDALEMGIWTRQHAGQNLSRLIHHSDRGVQGRCRRGRLGRQPRLAGQSYDNALAEALNSLFKAELVRNKGPWRSIDNLEIAVAEYIDWFNHRRLHGEMGMIPPVEVEQSYYDSHIPVGTTERVIESLH